MFSIQCTYTHGNSFGVSEEAEDLPISWPDIEQAKAALAAIREHYEAVLAFKNLKHRDQEAFAATLRDKAWFRMGGSSDLWASSIVLSLGDSTQPVQAFWLDYFGRFIEARIVLRDPAFVLDAVAIREGHSA